MLSKPVEKTTHVSLVPDFTPGSSSGVREAPSRDRQNPPNPGLICMRAVLTMNRWLMGSVWIIGCIGFSRGFLILILLGVETAPVGISRWLDVGQWVASGGLDPAATYTNMAAPIAMAWRHHDSCVVNPFPRPSEYNASDVDKLRELSPWLYFCVFPNFKGCKVSAGTLLPPGTTRVTHLAPPAGRLEDILPKTGDMIMAEMPCWKILDDKEKKRRKSEDKVTARAPAANVQVDAAANKGVGKEGPRKKRRVSVGPQVPHDLEYVSSPTPLNKAKPLEALANEGHASPPLSIGCMDTLRDQTDEHATSPRVNEGGRGNTDASHAIEGHGDNEGGLFGLQTRPSPAHHSGRRLDTLEEPIPANIVSDVEANKPFWQPSLYSSMGAHGIKPYGQLILDIGKGFMDGISIGREDTDVRAILQATPNVDPASSDIFMDVYEKLFEQIYPYVDKVACMYLLDPSGLQNIMPNETGPTPGEGPRDTPKASYA
nr:hypothetical protein [Tanacetum cinerariifolium]